MIDLTTAHFVLDRCAAGPGAHRCTGCGNGGSRRQSDRTRFGGHLRDHGQPVPRERLAAMPGIRRTGRHALVRCGQQVTGSDLRRPGRRLWYGDGHAESGAAQGDVAIGAACT